MIEQESVWIFTFTFTASELIVAITKADNSRGKGTESFIPSVLTYVMRTASKVALPTLT